ncbi:efflux RND transporter permease subunit [Acetobacteraceae bacterium ESL0709]|nr:efflux RND transporter permease subunit [Acetobacteraceae bacterium ESL0697]MDF7678793.1 efflux RND transporter permease subunit [Acetobacteraceae bacterium ESL0709]
MAFSRFFIDRPVATTLFALAIFLSGLIALPSLPVATMPDMTATSIMVVANQPGADPQQMVTSVTTPLERRMASIADLKTLESETQSGQASLFLEFSSSRNIDGALRDVQAALRAARRDLPTGTLNSDPKAFKMDGSGMPVYLLSLTSKQLSTASLYDLATIRARPLLAQINGVGRVEIVGASTPAVRVEVNPYPLYKWGVGLEDIRSALASANAFTPKGYLTLNGRQLSLRTNDQAVDAAAYRDLIIGYRNGLNPLYLRDIATISDSVQDIYQMSSFNGERAVSLLVIPQPHANTVDIVRSINEHLPALKSALPASVSLRIGIDLSKTIRASLEDAKLTLVVSILLVVLVIALFFRRAVSTLIPAITVPVSLSGTLAIMNALHFTLDILSLMALTIAVGFVVDDAIVVMENIARHMEEGMERRQASIRGGSEITFTVLSISLSLIAVFIPLLFIPGTLGSILYEFGMTTVSAIAVSTVISLTLTPMMCAHFLQVSHISHHASPSGFLAKLSLVIEGALTSLTHLYGRSIHWALKHPVLFGLTLPGSFILLVICIMFLPKEPVPAMDMAVIIGRIKGEPSLSFQALTRRIEQIETILHNDPAIVSVAAMTQSSNNARFFLQLKDKTQRASIDDVIKRIQASIPSQPGAEVMFWAMSNSRKGGSGDNDTGNFRYVLRSDDPEPLLAVLPRLMDSLRKDGKLINLTADNEQPAFAATIMILRDLEARYNVTPQLVQNALYDSYGQAVASTIHLPLTDHRVVLVLDHRWRENPQTLHHLWLSTSAGSAAGGIASNLIRVRTNRQDSQAAALARASITNNLANQISGNSSSGAPVSSSMETMIPLDNVAHIEQVPQPLVISHHDGSYAASLSFDLPPTMGYNDAVDLIERTLVSLHASDQIRGGFTGTAGETKELMINALIAFIAAIAVMYVTLGVLYESLIHPITILSTLPSAGIGGVLGLWIAGDSFSLIAIIGIILLTGLVKKNAILVVDFALQAERDEKLSPQEAVSKAAITRFRPILMTSLAAALGAIPLIIGNGYGCELRHPLGVSILGGMVVSQLLTLYTTPIVYLWMERVSTATNGFVHRLFHSRSGKMDSARY